VSSMPAARRLRPVTSAKPANAQDRPG
jgi:hypothetical protein